jgi:hypothetical protein
VPSVVERLEPLPEIERSWNAKRDRLWRAPEVNRELSALSSAILRLRPQLYAKWILESAGVALERVWARHWIRWPTFALIASIAVAATRRRATGPLTAEDRARWLAIAGIATAAAAFFVAKLTLVILVETPRERYVVAAIFLLPGALCAATFELWRNLAPSRHTT